MSILCYCSTIQLALADTGTEKCNLTKWSYFIIIFMIIYVSYSYVSSRFGNICTSLNAPTTDSIHSSHSIRTPPFLVENELVFGRNVDNACYVCTYELLFHVYLLSDKYHMDICMNDNLFCWSRSSLIHLPLLLLFCVLSDDEDWR